MMKSAIRMVVILTSVLAAASAQVSEAGIIISGSGTDATYDPTTGAYGGPPGTSNLGPISFEGVVNLPLTPTIINNAPNPGDIWFQAPFDGSQELTVLSTGDIIAGNFAGVVEWELISGDPMDDDFNPLPGSMSQGVWEAQLVVDPTKSTGLFAGVTGTLKVTAFNPPFDWTEAPYSFDWSVEGKLVPEPTSFAVFSILAIGLPACRLRRRR